MVFASLVLIRPASAQASLPPRTLSLKQALQMARERQIQVLIAEERVQQALARISQAKSSLRPQFSASASQYRRTVNLEAFGIEPGTAVGFDVTPPPFNVFDARIFLQQTLFDLTARRRLNAAKSGERLSEAERGQAEAAALSLVANLYIEAQRAQDAEEYIRALQRRERSRLGVATSEQSLGLGSAFRVTQSKAMLGSSESRVVQAHSAAVERRLDLAAALGLPQDQEIRFTSRESWLPTGIPNSSGLEALLEAHPDIVVAKRRVDLQVAELRQEKAEYYPKIAVNADVGASGTTPDNSTDTYSYGGQLSVPIYQGGLRRARLREAASKIRENEAQLDQTRRDRLADATRALVSLRQAQAVYRAAQLDLTRAVQALKLARDRRELGLGSDLEIVEAQADWAVAKDTQSEAVATYRLAWINLEYRLGRIRQWAEELKEP